MLLQDIGFELSGKIGGSAIREIKRVGMLEKSNHEISFLATHCNYKACTNKNIHCHLRARMLFTALAARRLEKPEKVKSIVMFARQVEIDAKRSIWQKVGVC
jgi:hypothetical protein